MLSLNELAKLLEPQAMEEFPGFITTPVDPALLSIAISTKRIADILDSLTIQSKGRPALNMRDLG